jgi:hypothetical protein
VNAVARPTVVVDWEAVNADFLKTTFAIVAKRLDALATDSSTPRAPPRDWLTPRSDGATPALLQLRTTFDLSLFETATLALCAAHELDSSIGPMCARAMGDPSRPWPTFALALRAFESGSWDAVTADGPLRACRLLKIDRAIGQPLVQSALSCDERILDFLKGLNQLDGRLGPLVTPFAPTGDKGDPAAGALLTRLWTSEAPQPVALRGADSSGRLETAAAAATACGRRLFRIEARVLPGSLADLDELARLWRREAALLPLVLYLEAGSEDAAVDANLRAFVAKIGGALVVSQDRGSPRALEDFLPVEVAPANADGQEATWIDALGEGSTDLAKRLAGAFDLSPGAIRRIAVAAALSDDPDAVWRECSASIRPKLDALAQRVEPRARWDDLVLPEAQRSMLRQIVDQVRLRRRVYDDWGYRAKLSRGLGVNALFAGESGTGKTMAAEVLAAELGLNLYRIDLSSIVSKYIGETEKNLRQLFDGAEQGGAILLFDEADALFGKRSDVKDSHDRYANIEVNYLLQRIESFAGLAILATNMKSSLDPAFLRRLRFVVQFPYPGPAERAALWRGAFPAGAPVEALRHEQLARINLTGGAIAAAAMNAAFLAAAEGAPVGMSQVLRAARAEMIKLNRPVNEADFLDAAPSGTLAGAA